jgi:hypothetical protein
MVEIFPLLATLGQVKFDRYALRVKSHEPPMNAESAGINRHGIGNERVLQERGSAHPDPETCRGHSQEDR